jgi:glycosyltransferase involved in cell wall biosynthesis
LYTVYNGIDSLRFQSSLSSASAREKLGIPPGHAVVSIIAVLRPEKNHPMFIRMAASVARGRPDTVFLIAGCPVAGDSRTQPELKALADQLGVTNKIRFLGLRSDVPEILKATDVLVLTSHLEGMSNALLEGMAAGVPFVTTNYAGVDELVTDQVEGSVVPLNDHEEMAKKVLQLLSDHELRARMSAAGRAKVNEQFGIPAMGDNLLRIYHQLLQSAYTHARAVTS